MNLSLNNTDRGTGLVEYALIVMFVGVVSMVAVSNMGGETSETFNTIADSFAAGEVEDDRTPDEEWEDAKAEYDDAIADAKNKKADDIADAKADYNSKIADNQSLPKAERKAANKEAKNEYNSAKTDANTNYKSSVQDAKEGSGCGEGQVEGIEVVN